MNEELLRRLEISFLDDMTATSPEATELQRKLGAAIVWVESETGYHFTEDPQTWEAVGKAFEALHRRLKPAHDPLADEENEKAERLSSLMRERQGVMKQLALLASDTAPEDQIGAGFNRQAAVLSNRLDLLDKQIEVARTEYRATGGASMSRRQKASRIASFVIRYGENAGTALARYEEMLESGELDRLINQEDALARRAAASQEVPGADSSGGETLQTQEKSDGA